MTTQERFAEDWGMPLDSVDTLVWLAKQAGKANKHYCNGDPHPSSKDKSDKSANAGLWGKDVDGFTKRIKNLTEVYGFTDVEYTGLGPTLKRNEQFVEVPY